MDSGSVLYQAVTKTARDLVLVGLISINNKIIISDCMLGIVLVWLAYNIWSGVTGLFPDNCVGRAEKCVSDHVASGHL